MDRIKVPIKDRIKYRGTKSYVFYSIQDLKETIEKDPRLEHGMNPIICYSRHPTTVRLFSPDLVGKERGESVDIDLFNDNITLEDELDRQLILHPQTAGKPESKLLASCALEEFLTHIAFPRYPNHDFNSLIQQMVLEDGLTVNPVLVYNPETNALHLATHHINQEFINYGEKEISFRSPR